MPRYNGSATVATWNQLVARLEDLNFKGQFRDDLFDLSINRGLLKDFLCKQRPKQFALLQKIFPGFEDVNIDLAEEIILTELPDEQELTAEYLHEEKPRLFNMLEMWYVEGILRNAALWNDTMRNLFEHM